MNFFRPTGNLDVAGAKIEPSKIEVTETKSIHSSEDELDGREAVVDRLASPPKRRKAKGLINRKQNKDFRSVWYDEDVEDIPAAPLRRSGLKKATSLDNLLDIGGSRFKPRNLLTKNMISSPSDPRRIVGEWTRAREVEDKSVGSVRRKLSGPIDFASAAVDYFSKKSKENVPSGNAAEKSENSAPFQPTNTGDETRKQEHSAAVLPPKDCVKTKEKTELEPADRPLEEKNPSLSTAVSVREETIDMHCVTEPEAFATKDEESIKSEENTRNQPEVQVTLFSSGRLDAIEKVEENAQMKLQPEEEIQTEKTEGSLRSVIATAESNTEKEEKIVEVQTEPQPVVEFNVKNISEGSADNEENVVEAQPVAHFKVKMISEGSAGKKKEIVEESEPQPVTQFKTKLISEGSADKKEKVVEEQCEPQPVIQSNITMVPKSDTEKEETVIEVQTKPQPIAQFNVKMISEGNVGKEEKVVEEQSQLQSAAQFKVQMTSEISADKEERVVEKQSEPQPVAQFKTKMISEISAGKNVKVVEQSPQTNVTMVAESNGEKEEKGTEIQPESQLNFATITENPMSDNEVQQKPSQRLCDAKNTVYGPETIVLPKPSSSTTTSEPKTVELQTFSQSAPVAIAKSVASPVRKDLHFKKHGTLEGRGRFRKVEKIDISSPILPKMWLGDGNEVFLNNLNSQEVTNLLKQKSKSTGESFVCILNPLL